MYGSEVVPLELTKLFTNNQRERHQTLFPEIFVDQKLRTVPEDKATCIIKFETILGAVCMIEGASRATGFLVKLPNGKFAFMTAGHVFNEETDKEAPRLLKTKSFRDYKLFFGNIDGDKNGAAAKRFTLGEFDDKFTLRGSIAVDGERLIIPGTAPAEKVHRDWDFGVLVLENATGSKLQEMELKWLECGEGDYLNAKQDGMVTIIGHPGGKAREGEKKEKRPLRLSFGKEIKPSLSSTTANNLDLFHPEKERGKRPPRLSPEIKVKPSPYSKTADNPDRIYYDYDSLGGSSGSPVIGRGCYAVKGIHVAGGKEGNIAQGLKSLLTWMIPEKVQLYLAKEQKVKVIKSNQIEQNQRHWHFCLFSEAAGGAIERHWVSVQRRLIFSKGPSIYYVIQIWGPSGQLTRSQ